MRGYRTYSVAVVIIVYAIIVHFWGTGVDGNQMIQMILGALGLSGLRAAIS